MVPPMADRNTRIQSITTGVLLGLAAIVAILFLSPARHYIFGWFALAAETSPPQARDKAVELIRDAQGNSGLRISPAALKSLDAAPYDVQDAFQLREMPAQIGTINFDIDYLFEIRPRFAGEVVSLLKVPMDDDSYPNGAKRDLTFNDRVKQGTVLGVYWSKDLGQAKGALVDAVVNKKQSEVYFRDKKKLYEEGNLSLALYQQYEKQLQNDINAYRVALYPLYVWRVPKDEIAQLEKEADRILADRNKPRDAEAEAKRWATVEIKAPEYALKDGKPDPSHELVVLEKNFNVGAYIDPGRDMPLFRLGDLSRLQVWVHPPEEYLPMLRTHLAKHGPGSLRWKIKLQSDPTSEQELSVSKISPSLDPTLKTPMLIGELKNPERKFLVGQVITATILLPPPANTVEVPPEAINVVESQNLVFVRKKDGKENEYYLRRVAVAHTAGKMTLVRSKLTEEDEKLSQAEQKRGRRPIQPLYPDEIVLTRGVVQLTAALEDLQTKKE